MKDEIETRKDQVRCPRLSATSPQILTVNFGFGVSKMDSLEQLVPNSYIHKFDFVSVSMLCMNCII